MDRCQLLGRFSPRSYRCRCHGRPESHTKSHRTEKKALNHASTMVVPVFQNTSNRPMPREPPPPFEEAHRRPRRRCWGRPMVISCVVSEKDRYYMSGVTWRIISGHVFPTRVLGVTQIWHSIFGRSILPWSNVRSAMCQKISNLLGFVPPAVTVQPSTNLTRGCHPVCGAFRSPGAPRSRYAVRAWIFSNKLNGKLKQSRGGFYRDHVRIF